MIEDRRGRFYFPRSVHRMQRGGHWLYYSSDRGVAVMVNELGRAMLDSMGETATAGELARRISGGQPVPEQRLLPLVASFLEEMKERGFLHQSPSGVATEEREPEDPLRLIQLYIHLTDRCNQQCIYCYNADQRNRQAAPGLPAEVLRRVMREAVALGAQDVVFTGGEPLLRKDTVDLGRYARRLGMRTSLLTNGTPVTEKRATGIAEVFDSVVVSLDSWRPEEFELLQPGVPLEKVVRGIRRLVAAGVSDLALRPVVTRHNLESMPGFPAWANEQLGCNRLLPTLYLPSSSDDPVALALLPDPSRYQEVMALCRQEVARLGGDMPHEELSLEAAGSCGAGTGVLSLSADGGIYPCQTLHHEEYRAGSVLQQSLSEIHRHSPVLQAFREADWPWFEACRDCALAPHCTATCRLFPQAFQSDGEAFIRHLCPFFKQNLEQRLWRRAELAQSAAAADRGDHCRAGA